MSGPWSPPPRRHPDIRPARNPKARRVVIAVVVALILGGLAVTAAILSVDPIARVIESGPAN